MAHYSQAWADATSKAVADYRAGIVNAGSFQGAYGSEIDPAVPQQVYQNWAASEQAARDRYAVAKEAYDNPPLAPAVARALRDAQERAQFEAQRQQAHDDWQNYLGGF